MPARPRPALRRLADGLATRLIRLPAPRTTTRSRGTSASRCATVSSCSPTCTTPTGRSAGTILVRSPYGWPVPTATLSGGVFAAPWVPRAARPVPGDVRLGRGVRAHGQRGGRRRRHRGLDARAALVRGPVRHLRRLVPRLHAVGPSRGPTAGARHRDHLDRAARLPRGRLPAGRLQPQRLPRLVLPDEPAGGRGVRGRPAAPGGRSEPPRQAGGPGAAPRRCGRAPACRVERRGTATGSADAIRPTRSGRR